MGTGDVRPDRPECHPALIKLWSKYSPMDGQVMRHLSANETEIVMPLIRDLPKKTARKLRIFGPQWLGLSLVVYTTVKGVAWYDDYLARLHRC